MNPREEYFKKACQGQQLTYDEWVKKVFWHPVGVGLRLNLQGLKILKRYFPYNIVGSDPGVGNPRTSKHYLFLARFCRKPYYIGSTHIAFFDEEEAFIFKLCDGDIDNVQEVAPERLADD